MSNGQYAIVEGNTVVGFVMRSQGIQTQFIPCDEAGLGWTYDPNTNTFVRPWTSAVALEEAKRAREELINSDLEGIQMSAPGDILNIQQTIQGLEAIPTAKALGLIPQEYPEVVSFRKSDNTFISMNLQEMQTLYLKYLLRKQQAWGIFQATVAALA